MLAKSFVVFAAVVGASAAFAQSCEDPIKARQTLMKRSGDMAKTGSAMIKGEAPYDGAKVKEIYAAFAEDASKMPTLFPPCSKTGDKTTASPAIWEKPDEFKAAVAKFAADIKAAQESTKDVATLKANFTAIGKNCSSCHETFRVKQS